MLFKGHTYLLDYDFMDELLVKRLQTVVPPLLRQRS